MVKIAVDNSVELRQKNYSFDILLLKKSIFLYFGAESTMPL